MKRLEEGRYLSYVKFSSSLEEERQNVLSRKSIEILGEAAKLSGHKFVTITSTLRYPEHQAIAMYNNLSRGKNMAYKGPGNEVVSVYNDCFSKEYGREATIDLMTKKIIDLSKVGRRVSLHCVSKEEYRKMNIVDISYRGLDVEAFIERLAGNESVTNILHDQKTIPNSKNVKYLKDETCVHVEIKQ